MDPRKKIVLNTDKTIGPSNFECNEGGVQTKGSFRNIGVALSALKTNLLRGEQTTLSVTVSGLQGIQQNVPGRLQNNSTNVVGIGGGDIQDFDITWAEVTSSGTWNRSFTMTGRNQGVFNITATVYWKNPTNPDGNNTAGQGPQPIAEDSRNVASPTTQEQIDAAKAKLDEKQKELHAAYLKDEAAWKEAIATADSEKVKAAEQATRDYFDAKKEKEDAARKFAQDPSDPNKRALDDAEKKEYIKSGKSVDADQAMTNSMDQAKLKAWLKAYDEFSIAVGEEMKAQKEWEDAVKNLKK